MTAWQIQEAKNKLSELIDCALSEGPQVITQHGVEVVVVMSITRYKKLTASKQRLGDFFLSSPLHRVALSLSAITEPNDRLPASIQNEVFRADNDQTDYALEMLCVERE